jgi:hypothetical protein
VVIQAAFSDGNVLIHVLSAFDHGWGSAGLWSGLVDAGFGSCAGWVPFES